MLSMEFQQWIHKFVLNNPEILQDYRDYASKQYDSHIVKSDKCGTMSGHHLRFKDYPLARDRQNRRESEGK